MASKQVTDRQKSADSVIAAGEANAEPIQEALEKLLKPTLQPGQSVPDHAAVVRLACGALAGARDRMVKADAAHDAERKDDPPAREARDTAQATLKEQLVGLREMIIGAYGQTTASRVFGGPTPEDPVVLARFAGDVAENLKKTDLPTPRLKGAKLDVAEIAEALAEKRAALEERLKDVQREVREAQQTLVAKSNAISEYDHVFGGVATVLAGLLRLAGKPELAAKVRPSSRRPGQTAVLAGEEAEAESPTGQ